MLRRLALFGIILAVITVNSLWCYNIVVFTDDVETNKNISGKTLEEAKGYLESKNIAYKKSNGQYVIHHVTYTEKDGKMLLDGDNFWTNKVKVVQNAEMDSVDYKKSGSSTRYYLENDVRISVTEEKTTYFTSPFAFSMIFLFATNLIIFQLIKFYEDIFDYV